MQMHGARRVGTCIEEVGHAHGMLRRGGGPMRRRHLQAATPAARWWARAASRRRSVTKLTSAMGASSTAATCARFQTYGGTPTNAAPVLRNDVGVALEAGQATPSSSLFLSVRDPGACVLPLLPLFCVPHRQAGHSAHGHKLRGFRSGDAWPLLGAAGAGDSVAPRALSTRYHRHTGGCQRGGRAPAPAHGLLVAQQGGARGS